MNQAAAESTGRGRTRSEEVHYGLIFFFSSKGDEAVGERGQKGRLRDGQRFASSALITALWVLDSSLFTKERAVRAVPQRGSTGQTSTSERQDQDLTLISVLQSPCFSPIPSYLLEDRTDPSSKGQKAFMGWKVTGEGHAALNACT